MAKQSSKNPPARIRFIMVDAEIPDGDLSQITAAIQNALKPTIIQQRVHSQAQPAALTMEGSRMADEAGYEESVEAEDVVPDAPRKPRSVKPRKLSSPKVIPLELKEEMSFESFVSQHQPKSDRDRNLVVAAFFKEHRATDEITVNHVYTCYRAMSWSTSIDDFGSTLRSLKKDQLIETPSRGSYAINHLGLDRVLNWLASKHLSDLHAFVGSTPGFYTKTAVEQLLLIAWFLEARRQRSAFDAAYLRQCFKEAGLDAPDMSVYLPRLAAKKPPQLRKERTGYCLAANIRGGSANLHRGLSG